jgi:hypothetical protein
LIHAFIFQNNTLYNKLTTKPTHNFLAFNFKAETLKILGGFIFMKTSGGASCLADRFLRYLTIVFQIQVLQLCSN